MAFGFKALRIAARIAVPMFIMLVAYISVTALTGHNLQEIIQLAPPGEPLTISAGITIVVGGAIVASLMTPDLTRYSKNGKHVLGVTIFTIIAGEFVVNGPAILIAKTPGTADVVTIMSQAAGGAGLLVVVFSTLRVNDLNLYSSSLGIVNAVEGITGKKLKYTYTTLVIGILGTTLSVLGILDRFVDFLTVLGVVFPPIIGIMLVDYYLLRSHRKITDESRRTASCQTKRQPLAGRRSSPASPVAPLVWRPNGAYRPSTLWWPPACCIGCSNWPSAGRKNRWPHRSRSDFRP